VVTDFKARNRPVNDPHKEFSTGAYLVLGALLSPHLESKKLYKREKITYGEGSRLCYGHIFGICLNIINVSAENAE